MKHSKGFALLMAAVMTMTMIPISVQAAELQEVTEITGISEETEITALPEESRTEVQYEENETEEGTDNLEEETNVSAQETVFLTEDSEMMEEQIEVGVPTLNAASEKAPTSGKCGDNLTWNLTKDGTLTISGIGEMDYCGWDLSWKPIIESIKTVIIKDGVTSIKSYAFSGAKNLSNVTIPSSVTEIGDSAFEGATNLSNITIPSSVTEIGYSAFEGATNLSNVTIPSSVTEVGSDAFLETAWEDKQGDFIIINGILVNYRGKATTVTIPNDVTRIGTFAFHENEELVAIIIQQGVKEIRRCAFSGCRNLVSATVPSSVVRIEDDAFNVLGKGDFSIRPDFIMYGYVNTAIEKFAYENNITFVALVAKAAWNRLAGNGRYDTMSEIVGAGFSKTGGTVVVATGNGFKDALAAAGLAGLYDAPVILTDGKTLSSQAQQQLKRLKPSKVYIAGGRVAVSDNVSNQIKKVTNVQPVRCFGQTSAGTSAALAMAGKGKWTTTAIIATNKTFKDALSAAPVSYSLHMPILLADNGKSLNGDVLKALKSCGIKKVIIVGGKLAVMDNVENQLVKSGIAKKNISRIAGNTAVDTSASIATYGLKHGMTINGMGVATSQNYPDALAGAALCGHNNSVLVLADDKAMKNTSFPTKYKAGFEKGYVFGGVYAVSENVVNALKDAVK